MRTSLRTAALALTLPAAMAASLPATAATFAQSTTVSALADSWQHGRERYRDYDGYGQRAYYGEPVYAEAPVWRGEDGRYYCKKKNGTTGLIVGGAAGALLGRSIAGRGDNTLGTILGAAGGALLGRELDRNGRSRRCR